MSDIFAKLLTPKRIYIILGIFVMANILATLKIVSDRTFFNSSDFIAYSIGARMILDGQGKNLYNLDLQTTYWDGFLKPLGVERTSPYILPYLAPPLTAVLFIPYTFLPVNMQFVVGLVVSVLVFLLGTVILGRTAKNTPLALLVVFSSWFVWVCVWQVQPTVWLFLVTVLLYRALDKQNYALAGFLCAFYIIKPQYLVIVPLVFLLTNKSWSFLRTFLLAFTVFVGLNLLLSSPQTLLVDYPKFLALTDNPNYGNRWYEMYSIQQLAYRFTQHLSTRFFPSTLLAGFSLYFAGLVVLNKNHTIESNRRYKFSAVIVLTLLTAYHVLPQDISLATISTLFVLFDKYPKTITRMLLASSALGSIATVFDTTAYYTILYCVSVYFMMRGAGKTKQEADLP